MKRLTKFSVEYPTTILMMVLGVILLGYISFDHLGIDLFPDLNNPRIFVEIKAGERPPEEMETQFVEQIEGLSIRQSDVTGVSSVSKVGSAQITVEYSWDKDMDEAFLDLQKALTSFSQNSDIEEFNITQHDPNADAILVVGISHDVIKDMNELRKIGENYIRNELIRLEGVADVSLSGQEESQVMITTNDYLLSAYGVTTDDIKAKIESYNRNVSGGSIEELGLKYIIKGESVFEELEDLRNLIITFKQGTENTNNTASSSGNSNTTSTGNNAQSNAGSIPILLKELAKVELINKDPLNIVRLNGERCIGLSIYKEPKFNTVKVVENLNVAFEEIGKALPGYHFTVVQNQGDFIKNAIDEVQESALMGVALAIIVLFVFLRRVGVTFIISVAIPVSIIATFNLMYFNDLTLNIMTLGGLALGAGMLVDNAIVVMENISRHLDMGKSVKEAAIEGTAEVGSAITASTITTIIVFLPIVYLHGASGELFKDQAWTVAFSLVSSLFVAILLIPMLTNRFFKDRKSKKAETQIRFNAYARFLNGIIGARWVVIIIGIAMVAGAAWVVPMVGSEYMPKTDANKFSVEVTLQEGTQLSRTRNTVKKLEHFIEEALKGNLEGIYSHIGTTGGGSTDQQSVFENENTATIDVILKQERTISSTSAITALGQALDGFPDMELKFIAGESALKQQLDTEDAPIIIEVKGREFKEIERVALEVRDSMNTNGNLFNVQVGIEEGAPEIDLVVDHYRAGIYDLTVDNIVNQLQSRLTGTEAGEYESKGELIDINIKLPDYPLKDLENFLITSGNKQIRLSEVATIKTVTTPSEIFRRNQSRVVRVTAHIKKDKAFDHAAANLEQQISNIVLPPGYQLVMAGEEQKRRASMDNLMFALVLSVILVYMVLASQFESLVHPFTILLTIPLAGVGAVFLFFLMGKTFNMMALIGIIMLVGIAVNDSIILVDAINQLKAQGMARRDAIIQAGLQRIRPIIMTSLTTILALLPLTFGLGESASLRSPMALAVIGGLITSTLLTLVVIPCVYYVFDQLIDLVKKPEVDTDGFQLSAESI